MKKYKLLPILLSMFLLAGCGSDVDWSRSVYSIDSAPASAETMSINSPKFSSMKGAQLTEKSANDEIAMEQEAGYGTENSQEQINRKLIKNVSMNLETTSFDKTIESIKNAVSEFGGYLEESGVSGSSIEQERRRYADLVARIPENRLDKFLSISGEFGNITYKNESINDITLQYSDTKDHIKTLEIERERLLTLMEEADSIETIIAIEERLSNIRYELESYQTQIKIYDNQVNYATVKFNIDEVKLYSTQSEDGIGTRIINGLKENFAFIARFLENTFVTLITSIPTLIVFGIFISVIIIGFKKLKLKRKIKKEKKNKIESKE